MSKFRIKGGNVPRHTRLPAGTIRLRVDKDHVERIIAEKAVQRERNRLQEFEATLVS